MLDKISEIIIFFLTLGMVLVISIFGIIIYQEIIDNEEVAVGTQQLEENVVNVGKTEDTIIKENEKKEEIDKNIQIPPNIVENPINSLQNYNSENNKNTNYSNITVNKYYYNQLEDYSKIIYRAFEASKEEMKTGTHKINFGEEFSNLLSQENGQEELGKYYQSAIEAYIYDNTDVFYLSPNKMFLNIETITKGNNVTYNVFIDNGEEENYLVDEFNSKEKIDIAISKINEIKEEVLNKMSKMNTYESIKWIHDYLIQYINYDTTISRPNIYNVYGALVDKECVCEGYARAFKYLLDNINVECIIIIGEGTNSQNETESHAWNYVKIDNQWYAVDVTWDDPVVIGGGNQTQESKYKFFLKGSQEFNQNHTPIGNFSKGGKYFKYPTISEKNYK